MNDPTDGRMGQGQEHLRVEEVVAYVHRTVSDEERRLVEAHLADCDRCREEVVVASRGAGPAPSRSRRWWMSAAVVAGLAGIIAVGLLGRGIGSEEELRFRDGPAFLQSEELPRIQVVAPGHGASVDRNSAQFTWRAPEGAGFYRFTLTDASGDVLLSRDLPDTTLTIGPEVPLAAGQEYFWYVDTLLETGASATTDVRRFRVEVAPRGDEPP